MRYKPFLTYIIFSGVFLLLAIVTGLEFSTLPFDGTWGSDAQYYYLAAVGQGGEASCSAYLGYGYVCAFTAFVSILDLPIAFYSVIGLLYLFIVFRFYQPRDGYTLPTVWMLLVFNPVILWTFLKGVKEGFVITSLVILVKIYGRVVARRRVIDVLIFLAGILVLSTVKFEAVAFVVLAVVATEFIMRSNNRIKRTAILVFTAVALLFVIDQLGKIFPEVGVLQKLMAHKDLFFNEEISDPEANINYFFAIFRFLVGPGPITPLVSLFQDIGFYEPTSIGKVLIFLGSLCWLTSLVLAVLGFVKVLSIREYRNGMLAVVSREAVFSALMALLYVLTYSYMYGGMVDTRHRAVVYILLAPLFAPLASLGAKYLQPDSKQANA